jgi:hypothetical protein
MPPQVRSLPVCSDNEAEGASQVPVILDQVEDHTASVMADGAYDGEPVYQAIHTWQPEPLPSIVIPPRSSAVCSLLADVEPSQRDDHITV